MYSTNDAEAADILEIFADKAAPAASRPGYAILEIEETFVESQIVRAKKVAFSEVKEERSLPVAQEERSKAPQLELKKSKKSKKEMSDSWVIAELKKQHDAQEKDIEKLKENILRIHLERSPLVEEHETLKKTNESLKK